MENLSSNCLHNRHITHQPNHILVASHNCLMDIPVTYVLDYICGEVQIFTFLVANL